MADDSSSTASRREVDALPAPTDPTSAEVFKVASAVSVDGRARAALELAALAVEHSAEGLEGNASLGRKLKTVADTCAEATRVLAGLARGASA